MSRGVFCFLAQSPVAHHAEFAISADLMPDPGPLIVISIASPSPVLLMQASTVL